MLVRFDDWEVVRGQRAEVRLAGRTVCTGIVGAVIDHGRTVWIQPFLGPRRAFAKEDSYEIWAAVRD